MKYVILIADDEAEIRDLLRLYLENSGYDVLEAADGLEALEVLEKEHVDLAVLDVMMPRMNGLHVLKKIRETSNIPVLVFSAKDADSDKILGLNLGADDYLTKPFNPLEAVARIQSNIRRFYSLGGHDGKMESETGMIPDIDIPEEADYAEIDKMQFSRAFTNLLTNAIKHNEAGISIKISMKKKLSYLVIKVMDSGERIDPELAQHLFDPFVMGDESRNSRGGSGLGLSVSKKVIEMHGGNLTLEQPTEEGYTKAFCIKIKQVEEKPYEYE